MTMNRRAAIGASLAASAIPFLPSVALAGPTLPITIAPNAAGHKFEALAGQWCIERMREGLLYFQHDAYFGYLVKLTDPHFRIEAGKPVWNWMTGYTEEEGVAITVSERGIPLGRPIGIGTSIGYEEYWEKPRPDGMPDYYVRRHHIPWEEMKLIEKKLPKNHMELDMRWMENLAKKA